MAKLRYIFRSLLLVLSVTALSAAAVGAAVTAKQASNYGRFTFTFKEPVKLKATSNGASAVLVFDKPVRESSETITKALPDYIRYAVISDDKKRVTLTLYQPYRIRQFTSGNSVGVDFVGAPTSEEMKSTVASKSPSAETKKAVAKAEKSKSEPDTIAKKMAAEAPSAAKPEPTAPASPPDVKAESPAASASAAPKATEKTDPMLSTKAPEEKAPQAPAKPESQKTQPATPEKQAAAPSAPAKPETKAEKPAAAPTPEAMLSTKAAELAKAALPAAAPTSPTPAKAPDTKEPAQDPMLSTKAATPPAATKPETTASEPKKQVASTASASPTTMHPVATTAVKGTAISIKTDDNASTLTFPWSERTALATFKRSRDIWVVFSRSQALDVQSLRSKLPKQIVNVTQYTYEGNTVLRFVTDGSLSISASQVKGNYHWNVIFSNKPSEPSLDIPVSADTLNGTTRLLLGVFDVAPMLKFYDPTIGDMLIVIPAYENGRGANPARNFPEFSILATNQGIAMISKRLDLTTQQTRSGLVVNAPGGLSISDTLPTLSSDKPIASASGIPSVMMPYNQWHVQDEPFLETIMKRMKALSQSSKADRPARLFDVAKTYLTAGMMPETSGILDIIKKESPSYYEANRLALLHGACYVLSNRYADAKQALAAPELKDMEEAVLWRQALALSTPTAGLAEALSKTISTPASAEPITATDAATIAPHAGSTEPAISDSPSSSGNVFQLLKFNKQFIRFYPPRIRQQLTLIASDAYIRDKQPEKALAAFDILERDGIHLPVKMEQKLALAATAAKKGQFEPALMLYDLVSAQNEDRRAAVKARVTAIKLRYETKEIDGEIAAEMLENARITWHGKPIERDILDALINIYIELKRHDQLLRTQKAILDSFPEDPNSLALSASMSDLFKRIFLDGLADEMEPLKALSLFYEFRELTPLGDNGDRMIQKLADRLAAVDLLSRATQLLEHQIKYRLSGEPRSRVGTRLALLYLLNKQPKEALNALEVTNYGANTPELKIQRQQLLAASLNALEQNEEALNALYQDKTPEGANLRLEILWSMQDWSNVANRAEDILTSRPNLTDPLTPKETETLIRLALAYTFQGDYVQLRYLRDYYSSLIPNSGYQQIFDFITNDTTPLDPDDFKMVTEQISRTENFLSTFKDKIAQGKLSEAIK